MCIRDRLTGDRDLYGAVSDQVAVVDLRKGSEQAEIGPNEVRERYGVDPGQVPDFIALRGDPSDGLPGAPGIGAKTAAELLRTHSTLEALLEQAERQCEDGGLGDLEGTPSGAQAPHRGGQAIELRPRIAQSLHENAELLRTFKRVATLVEIDVERPPDKPTDFAGGATKA